AELRQQRSERAPAPDGIAVQTCDARAGTRGGNLRFNALGPESGLFEIGAGTKRTDRGHARCVVAVVASRAPRMAVAMHDERHAAVRAVERPGALATEHRGGEAAAVQEHERLLASRELGANAVSERAAEDHVRAFGRV